MFFSKKHPKQKPKKKIPPINTKPLPAPKSLPPPPKPTWTPPSKPESEWKPPFQKPESKPKQPKEEKINPAKEFEKTFRKLTYRHQSWDIWRDFVTMFACALSNPVDKAHYDEREALYLEIINRYQENEQKLFPELAAYTIMALEENPEQDFLGSIYMSMNLGNRNKGQVFTPYHVCELMADITMDDVTDLVNEKGYISINDCACGAGATLIAAINKAKYQLGKTGINFQNHVLIVAQDIDTTVALMCYIQISLLGVAGYVKIGNSITEPITPNDSTENYWFTPMYFSKIWTLRRFFHGKVLL